MINQTPEHIAAVLRSARAGLGWSQGQLAKSAKVSIPTLARIETCATRPKTDILFALFNALEGAGVEVVWGEPGKFSLNFDVFKK